MIYVDDLVLHATSPLGRREWCHMIADSLDELHAMASRIGMRPAWFQPRSFPHYDLVASRRARAVRLGAIECDRRIFVGHLQRIRAGLSAAPAGHQ